MKKFLYMLFCLIGVSTIPVSLTTYADEWVNIEGDQAILLAVIIVVICYLVVLTLHESVQGVWKSKSKTKEPGDSCNGSDSDET